MVTKPLSASDADRRYFERFPLRRHRLRPASPKELAQVLASGNRQPPGHRLCVAVKNVIPGVQRMRRFMWWPEDVEIEVDEARARFEYDAIGNDFDRRFEAVAKDAAETVLGRVR